VTGLGLAIARRLIELMSGRLSVESAVGQGTTFHFIARLGRAREPLARRSAAEPGILQGLPVLAVDDNETNRRLYHGILTAWGMKPTIVNSGRAALAALETARRAGTPFRLVLLDGRLPDVDSFALAERLQEDSTIAGTTILLVTSDPQRGDIAHCRALGIARYLVKPITSTELLEAMLLALGESGAGLGTLPSAEPIAEPRGLRVLVAEDNPVNQMLAVRMLQKLGHEATVVPDGRAAVAAVEAEAFDLVLMDVQMPEMDGFAAAAAIRQHEAGAPGRPRIPIIALTAHALKGDREQCLAAGMDDYLSKPLNHPGSRPSQPAARSDAPPASPSCPDLSVALEYVGGDRELLQELLAIFAHGHPGRVRALREAVGRGDPAEVMRTAHTIKGALRALGTKAAAAFAEQLESMGREQRLDGGIALVEALERESAPILRFAAESRGNTPCGS
jgi:CheY-like chemotaxis protein